MRQEWEYQLLQIDPAAPGQPIGPNDVGGHLQAAGADGWEAWHMMSPPGSGIVLVWLKRPVVRIETAASIPSDILKLRPNGNGQR